MSKITLGERTLGDYLIDDRFKGRMFSFSPALVYVARETFFDSKFGRVAMRWNFPNSVLVCISSLQTHLCDKEVLSYEE